MGVAGGGVGVIIAHASVCAHVYETGYSGLVRSTRSGARTRSLLRCQSMCMLALHLRDAAELARAPDLSRYFHDLRHEYSTRTRMAVKRCEASHFKRSAAEARSCMAGWRTVVVSGLWKRDTVLGGSQGRDHEASVQAACLACLASLSASETK